MSAKVEAASDLQSEAGDRNVLCANTLERPHQRRHEARTPQNITHFKVPLWSPGIGSLEQPAQEELQQLSAQKNVMNQRDSVGSSVAGYTSLQEPKPEALPFLTPVVVASTPNSSFRNSSQYCCSGFSTPIGKVPFPEMGKDGGSSAKQTTVQATPMTEASCGSNFHSQSASPTQTTHTAQSAISWIDNALYGVAVTPSPGSPDYCCKQQSASYGCLHFDELQRSAQVSTISDREKQEGAVAARIMSRLTLDPSCFVARKGHKNEQKSSSGSRDDAEGEECGSECTFGTLNGTKYCAALQPATVG